MITNARTALTCIDDEKGSPVSLLAYQGDGHVKLCVNDTLSICCHPAPYCEGCIPVQSPVPSRRCEPTLYNLPSSPFITIALSPSHSLSPLLHVDARYGS